MHHEMFVTPSTRPARPVPNAPDDEPAVLKPNINPTATAFIAQRKIARWDIPDIVNLPIVLLALLVAAGQDTASRWLIRVDVGPHARSRSKNGLRLINGNARHP